MYLRGMDRQITGKTDDGVQFEMLHGSAPLPQLNQTSLKVGATENAFAKSTGEKMGSEAADPAVTAVTTAETTTELLQFCDLNSSDNCNLHRVGWGRRRFC